MNNVQRAQGDGEEWCGQAGAGLSFRLCPRRGKMCEPQWAQGPAWGGGRAEQGVGGAGEQMQRELYCTCTPVPLCVCVCVRTLTPVPTSEGHRFPGGQAVLINLTFINGFLSLFDFMCELPATQQQAMGMDNTTGGEDGGRALQLPDQ